MTLFFIQRSGKPLSPIIHFTGFCPGWLWFHGFQEMQSWLFLLQIVFLVLIFKWLYFCCFYLFITSVYDIDLFKPKLFRCLMSEILLNMLVCLLNMFFTPKYKHLLTYPVLRLTMINVKPKKLQQNPEININLWFPDVLHQLFSFHFIKMFHCASFAIISSIFPSFSLFSAILITLLLSVGLSVICWLYPQRLHPSPSINNHGNHCV